MDHLDAPLGGPPYHNRYLQHHERWMHYTRRLKLRLGLETHRAPGLNSWVTLQRGLEKTPKSK